MGSEMCIRDSHQLAPRPQSRPRSHPRRGDAVRPRHRDEDETWAAIEGAVQAGGDFEMDWAAMYMNQVVEEDSFPNTERA